MLEERREGSRLRNASYAQSFRPGAGGSAVRSARGALQPLLAPRDAEPEGEGKTNSGRAKEAAAVAVAMAVAVAAGVNAS